MSVTTLCRLALLAFCCGLAAVPAFAQKSGDVDPEPPAAYKPPKTLEDLAKLTANPQHLQRGAALLKKNYADLSELEKAYKPRRKGGIGVGPAANTDGIEMKTWNLQRRQLTPAALKNEKNDLVKLAQTTLAINEITRLFFEKPIQGKGAKEWAKYTDEVKKGAEDLLKAVKAQDTAAVRKAAQLIVNGCVSCHSDFRQ